MSARTNRLTRLAPLAAASATLALVLSACGSPGGDAAPTDPPASPPAAVDPGNGDENGGAAAGAFTCGTDDIVMNAYIESGFPLAEGLFDLFTEQYPNVTWNVVAEQFDALTTNSPRVLVDNPPDIIRLPMVAGLASEGLLYNLDAAADYFGWAAFGTTLLDQMRVDAEGRRGDGPLFAMGLNVQMTGVFYNRELAAQAGMTAHPATMDEFEAIMQAAVDAGLPGSPQFNAGAEGGMVFPLQLIMASYGDPAAINDWIFQQPGATIDSPELVAAAERLNSWIERGFFADDINAIGYSDMMGRFLDGEGLFIFNGDWESGTFDSQSPGEFGFFPMPPVTAGGRHGAMSTPLTFGIAARAANPGCAAYFFNWVATNEAARTLAIEIGGSIPMGTADAFLPPVDADSVTGMTLAAGPTIAGHSGAMDFIANATPLIYAESWTPNIQLVAVGQLSAADLLANVQADYLNEIG